MKVLRLRTWNLLALPVLLVLPACSADADEEVPSEAVTAEAAVAAAEETEATPNDRPRPFLPAAMQRASRAETFPHETHVEISCAVCHGAVQGHASHGASKCADCHRNSGFVTQETVSREECLSCHHGPLQEKECVDCHNDAGQRVAAWPLQLGIWPGPRSRSLSFEHEVHQARDCALCHKERPSLIPDVDCATCHEDHHHPEARCMTCHLQPPEGAHDLNAHLGCGGAGCHSDPRFEALVLERATCLVCHQNKEDHEPGKQCAECHQVRDPDAAAADVLGSLGGGDSPYLHVDRHHPLGGSDSP